jgi:hypothetical protein
MKEFNQFLEDYGAFIEVKLDHDLNSPTMNLVWGLLLVINVSSAGFMGIPYTVASYILNTLLSYIYRKVG